MKIVITLEGGIITSVSSDRDIDAQVIIVDYDTDWVDDTDDFNIVEIDGNSAHVYHELDIDFNQSYVDKMSNLI